MAKQVFKDAVITVDASALSNHANELTTDNTADEVEFTAFGANYREFGQGLKDATVTVVFFQDFAAASVDAVLQPLYDSGGTFVLTWKATSAAVSATNPQYSMTSRLFSYGAISGAIGDALTVEATFRNAGQAGITKAIA